MLFGAELSNNQGWVECCKRWPGRRCPEWLSSSASWHLQIRCWFIRIHCSLKTQIKATERGRNFSGTFSGCLDPRKSPRPPLTVLPVHTDPRAWVAAIRRIYHRIRLNPLTIRWNLPMSHQSHPMARQVLANPRTNQMVSFHQYFTILLPWIYNIFFKNCILGSTLVVTNKPSYFPPSNNKPSSSYNKPSSSYSPPSNNKPTYLPPNTNNNNNPSYLPPGPSKPSYQPSSQGMKHDLLFKGKGTEINLEFYNWFSHGNDWNENEMDSN